MNGYEKLIKTIRSEAERDLDKNPLKVAVMTSSTGCKYSQIELDKDDLVFLDHLYDQHTGESKLKSGDKVIIEKLNSEKFVILGKVRA